MYHLINGILPLQLSAMVGICLVPPPVTINNYPDNNIGSNNNNTLGNCTL